MIHRITTTIFLLPIYSFLFAQLGSVRVEVLGGANISFIFNSIEKYKNGITKPDYTTLGITVNDNGNAAYLRWELTVEFDDADADGFLNGLAPPVNDLLFSTVEVTTNITGGCGGCREFAPVVPLPLTNAPQVLVDGGGGADDVPPNYVFTTDQIAVSYYVGVNACPCPPGNNLLGSPADFYADEILYTITMYDF